jgi:hypothetical protein
VSWHYSQALVEEYSEENSVDGKQFALLKSTSMPEAYCWRDRTTEPLNLFQYGMTSRPSTVDHGEALLTWFREVFLVKTSHVQGVEKVSQELDQDFGKTWQELSVRFDHVSCSWRILRHFGYEVLPWSSRILPSWGFMLNGALYRRRTSERPIKGIGSGSWPTPTVNGNYNRKGLSTTSGDGLATAVKRFPTPSVSASKQGQNESDGRRGQTLVGAARGQTWPTPRTGGICGGTRALDKLRENTTAVEARGMGSGHGGVLNPAWVEILMGWPENWTSLESLSQIVDWGEWTGNWERDVPRVGNNIKNRDERLKAIGNGQVPRVAAVAWRILTVE